MRAFSNASAPRTSSTPKPTPANASDTSSPATTWTTSSKIHTPNHLIGYSIAEAQVHERYGVTVVAVKSPNRDLEYGSKDLVMHRNDELILMGTQDQIEQLIRG